MKTPENPLKISCERIAFDIRRAIDEAEVVSFDVFETLLIRPYLKPRDLWRHLEETSGHKGFATRRIKAEKRCQKEAHKQKHDKITLSDIYAILPPEEQLFYQAELKLEKQVLRPNPIAQALFHYAETRHKKIILVADTYLPRTFLRLVLKEQGFQDVHRLYVSGNIRKTQKRNPFFEYLAADLNLPARRICHISSHKKSAILQARKAGLSVRYLPKISTLFLKNSKEARAFLKAFPSPPPRGCVAFDGAVGRAGLKRRRLLLGKLGIHLRRTVRLCLCAVY